MTNLFPIFISMVVLVLALGLYCVLSAGNVIRILIGVELMTKAATLAIVLAGYLAGQMALAQCLAITLIVVEVAVIAVAAGIAVGIFRRTGSLDTSELKTLKG
ncbi:MAG: NADH-quinone oxidoreductase subunit K [Kiritimatiellia bacterium]|nr:NADH-quinone oxidoreductase subunit K [Kiritimatiellia bacterium]